MDFNMLPSMTLYRSDEENFHNKKISDIKLLKRFLKIKFLHLYDKIGTLKSSRWSVINYFITLKFKNYWSKFFFRFIKIELSIDNSVSNTDWVIALYSKNNKRSTISSRLSPKNKHSNSDNPFSTPCNFNDVDDNMETLKIAAHFLKNRFWF